MADLPQNGVPPLEVGDRLTRAEFERRYEAMPRLRKAELIEGVVYVPSPARIRRHGKPQGQIITWLGYYEAATPGLEMADNSTVRLDLDNEPQPDALLIIAPEFGGQVKISEDDFVEGAPEWVGEISASTASYDLNIKLHVYRRNGVREYVVWRVLEKEIDWFVLQEGQFERLALDDHGLYKSTVFPGLWLDPAAMIRGDMKKVLAVVQRGIDSAEHAAFVQRLHAARAEEQTSS